MTGVVALLAVASAVLAFLATRSSPDEGVVVAAPSDTEAPPDAEPTLHAPGTAEIDPERAIGVVDPSGEFRGYVDDAVDATDPQVELPGGFRAKPVYSSAGNLVGYLVAGPHGFVDLETGDDGERLAALNDCYEDYASDGVASDACTELLVSEGNAIE